MRALVHFATSTTKLIAMGRIPLFDKTDVARPHHRSKQRFPPGA